MNFCAGCQSVQLFDLQMNMAFPTLVMYPSDAPEQPAQLGPYKVNVAMDGPIATGRHTLVVISHGTGGSHLVYRNLAAHLARNGYVVAIPEHPRNNRNNNDLGGTAANLENRPRHIRLATEWVFRNPLFGPQVKPDAIAIIGHSLGGYTALAAAGGRPRAFPSETQDGQARPIEVTPDSRVKALVLLAPATVWFMEPGTLGEVRMPILMFTAEKDPHTPEFHGDIVKRGVPDPALVERRIVPNAGHFSFLSPFPQAMTSTTFPPSQDPPGFDRVRFHDEMHAAILAFLNRELSHA